jgi:hypothetical protein
MGWSAAKPLGANQQLAFTPLAGAGPLLGNRKDFCGEAAGGCQHQLQNTTPSPLNYWPRIFQGPNDLNDD